MTSQPTTTRDILLQTDRLEDATSFYEHVLGLPVFHREPTLVGIETGAFRLFLDKSPTLGPVLEFVVDDVQARKTDLVAAGCTVEQEDPTIPRCYMRDPYGLIFNLSQASNTVSK